MDRINVVCDDVYLKAGLENLIMQHSVYQSGRALLVVAVSLNSLNEQTRNLIFNSGRELILLCDRKLFSFFSLHIGNANSAICSYDITRSDFNKLLDDFSKKNKRKVLHRQNDMRVLTASETKVIEFLWGEKNDNSIAEKMNISIKTVSAHKRNALYKMGIRSVSELVMYRNLLNSVV